VSNASPPHISGPQLADICLRYTELPSNCSGPLDAAQADNLQYFRIAELGEGVPLTHYHGPVSPLIELVLAWCRPAQMLRITASRIAAGMRRLKSALRFRPVSSLAGNYVNIFRRPIPANDTIASLHSSVRPNQAPAAIFLQNNVLEKAFRSSVERVPCVRIAVAAVSSIVRSAKPTQAVSNWVAAVFDSAYRWISHGVSPHVVVRAGQRANAVSGPFLIAESPFVLNGGGAS